MGFASNALPGNGSGAPHDILPPHTPATQRVGALARIPRLLRENGADPAAVLAHAGLAADVLDDVEARIPYRAIGRMLAEAARATGLPHFGLLVGAEWTPESLGPTGQVMRHCETVGDAVRMLSIYQRLNSDGGTAFVIERADGAVMGYAIYESGVEGVPQIYDIVMAIGYRLLGDLLQAPCRLREVSVARSEPADIEPYRKFFGAPLRFNRLYTALHLPRTLLDQPIPGADPAMHRVLLARLEAATAPHLIHSLRRALRLLLLHGNSSGDDVAQELSLHRRTLNRRLKAQGTTFQALLDQVRQEVAGQLLRDTSVGLDDVALATGYADTSTFVRAFRRWNGTTPAKWRVQIGNRG